jgi:hypothetical protein
MPIFPTLEVAPRRQCQSHSYFTTSLSLRSDSLPFHSSRIAPNEQHAFVPMIQADDIAPSRGISAPHVGITATYSAVLLLSNKRCPSTLAATALVFQPHPHLRQTLLHAPRSVMSPATDSGASYDLIWKSRINYTPLAKFIAFCCIAIKHTIHENPALCGPGA